MVDITHAFASLNLTATFKTLDKLKVPTCLISALAYECGGQTISSSIAGVDVGHVQFYRGVPEGGPASSVLLRVIVADAMARLAPSWQQRRIAAGSAA